MVNRPGISHVGMDNKDETEQSWSRMVSCP